MHSSLAARLVLLGSLLAACSEAAPPGPAPSADRPAGERPKPAEAGTARRTPTFDFGPGGSIPEAELGAYHVALTCAIDGEDVGTMTLALWPQHAPITVRNFLRLCDEGFYDGLGFHRILREFMVQGGDPEGNGSGNSHYGTIRGEFSEAPERAHGYGVISMARLGGQPDSASCQFFVCCDEGPNVWNLDGEYASFGRLTSGVATLEALASVPVRSEGSEPSVPTKKASIVRAEVRKGPAPTGERIARPAPDLGGEPPTVLVQHVLVSFQGVRGLDAKRSREEAEALAGQILERARAGESFQALVLEHSDDPVQPGDETPGVYRLNNRGVRDLEAERRLFRMSQAAQEELQQLGQRQAAGELTQEQLLARRDELVAPLRALQESLGSSREQMVPGFADVAFGLAPGEVGIAPHDAQRSPYGWHVIKRLE